MVPSGFDQENCVLDSPPGMTVYFYRALQVKGVDLGKLLDLGLF